MTRTPNATMVDSSNVLLLRPARPGSGFSREVGDRPQPGASRAPSGLVVATVCSLARRVDADLLTCFEQVLAPALTRAGASILACFVTEDGPNDFPALPVREAENVFVWFSHWSDQTAYEHHVTASAGSRRGNLPDALASRLVRPPEVLRLSPTCRSQLRG